MGGIFEIFDEKIGVDGYYQIIQRKLFPTSTETSIDVAAFHLQERIFRKGSIFSRVRYIHEEKAEEFIKGNVTRDDFFPPKPHKIDIPQGRFNRTGERTGYLADHPFVAMLECDISAGDNFLLSNIEFSKNMRFVFVEPDKDEFSHLLYQLLNAKDERFYSVINKVNNDILSFQGFQGIAYNSTKVPEGYVDQTWGTVDSTMNLALSGENIKQTELAAGWLAYCNESGRIFQRALFKPLSNKKKSKISRVNYQDNRSAYILESQKVMRELNEKKQKTAQLLNEGDNLKSSHSPMKILWK